MVLLGVRFHFFFRAESLTTAFVFCGFTHRIIPPFPYHPLNLRYKPAGLLSVFYAVVDYGRTTAMHVRRGAEEGRGQGAYG
jgi:hypothetical protein